jgi:trehalose 6-phosphate phosphatase
VKSILRPAGRDALARFAGSRVLLAFDFDGTLAPLVRDPDRARMRPSTARLLRRVARLYPCVVISGRSRADVLARVRGLPVRGVIGNHGAETGRKAPRVRRDVARWRELLRSRLRGRRGLRIEDKTYSLAVHYRGGPGGKPAAAIREAAAGLRGARVFGGRRVVNVVAAASPDKGAALALERRRLRCETAIYVGDDETDEDVFARADPRQVLTLRVGAGEASSAAFTLPRQAAVDRLLALLAALRGAASGGSLPGARPRRHVPRR